MSRKYGKRCYSRKGIIRKDSNAEHGVTFFYYKSEYGFVNKYFMYSTHFKERLTTCLKRCYKRLSSIDEFGYDIALLTSYYRYVTDKKGLFWEYCEIVTTLHQDNIPDIVHKIRMYDLSNIANEKVILDAMKRQEIDVIGRFTSPIKWSKAND